MSAATGASSAPGGTAPPGVRVGVGTANGTFGELLQGALPGSGAVRGEGRFLVTLPVARWSTARFELAPGPELTVVPTHKVKAMALAGALLRDLGLPAAGRLHLSSSIPEGKGLASSSADLVATARAVTAAAGRSLPLERIGRLLADVEPTDGVMYPGIVAFDHRRGARLASLGSLPTLQVVAVDQGGHVDTVAFNQAAAGYDVHERRHYRCLLERMRVAVGEGDLAEVGRISTRSAALNQARLPHRDFAALTEICSEVSGLGLVTCHSGTMTGILLNPGDPAYRARLSTAVRLAGELSGPTHLYRTLAGRTNS